MFSFIPFSFKFDKKTDQLSQFLLNVHFIYVSRFYVHFLVALET